MEYNSYKLFNLRFFEKLLGSELEVVVYLNLKSNRFISDSKGVLEIGISPHLERKMVSSNIITNDSFLKYQLVTQHKDG
jgi:hypothetical protein